MAEATTPIATASNPRVGEDVGRALAAFVAAEAERVRTIEAYNAELKHQRERGIFPPKVQTEYEAMERAQRNFWTAQHDLLSVASAPSPEAGAGGDLGELERLSAAADPGLVSINALPDFTYINGSTDWCIGKFGDRADAEYVAALWNAHRSGKLVASTGSEDETKGATPMGSGWSSSTEPKVSALTGDHPSRGEVDFDELNRLFALMPEGPWQDMRSTGGHEIRQIDTDPTNKHHWPFRLCQSIAGQRAVCDDAVFAFIAGVLNAWPSIAAANSDDAFIERTLAMPEDELRKRFLIDGKCPEQAADAARQSLRIAKLKVALIQISSQYVVNRHDMTDAEALEAIRKIADRALAGEAAQAAETAGLGSRASGHEVATPEATPKSSPDQTPVDPQKAVKAFRTAALAAIQDLRHAAACNFSPAYSGSLGEARCNSFYEAYEAVRKLAPSDAPSTTEADR